MATTPAEEERVLAARACAGDKAAFSALVSRYQRPIYALCMRYLRGSDAEDAAQETFVRAFVHRHEFDSERPMMPWLMTIARRLCLDRLRRHKTENLAPEADAALAPDHAPGTFQQVASRQQLARLQAAFAGLAEGPREALAMYHFHDLSYQQIAETLQVPLGTVMTWLHRGRAELKKKLGEGSGAV